MATYQPLTKIIIDEKGNQMVTCRYYGTEECRKIHTPSRCSDCPMLAAIFNQLRVFEEIYTEEANSTNAERC